MFLEDDFQDCLFVVRVVQYNVEISRFAICRFAICDSRTSPNISGFAICGL
jgi:hypothetical protein